MAAAIVAAACSGGSEAGTDVARPTFDRASGDGLVAEEPVADLADLVAPRGDETPWTIVGSVYDPDSRAAEATVWTSDDGRGWEPTTVDPASRGTGETMAAAATTDDGLLAVGQVGDGTEADAAIWRQDGGAWRRETPEVMGGEHEQWAFAVTVGESGILVAGGENVWGEVRPRLWFSADGESWTTVDGGAGGPLDATGEESVRGVAAVGTGFVAVGARHVEAEQDGVAWFSPDGESWEQVEAPSLAGPRRQELLTVAAVEGGVVAGGYISDDAGQGQPITWRSTDGRTWSAPSAPLPAGTDIRRAASDLAVRSVTSAPQGLIAAGGSEARPHVWQSVDGGATWTDLPNPVHGELFQDGIALLDAEGDGERTIAIGSEPSVLMLAGARWQNVGAEGFPSGGAQPFATSVASNGDNAIAAGGHISAPTGEARERFTGQVWRRDGGDWAPVDSEMLSAGYVMDAAAFRGGFVAVGFEDFGLADERTIAGDPGPDGLVWVSENGTDWARMGVENARIDEAMLEFLEDPSPEQAGVIAQMEAETPSQTVEPAGGRGTRSLGAVAPLGDGYIAVGSVYDRGDADPVIVVSPDGTTLAGEPPVHKGGGIQRYNDVCVGPDGTVVAVGVSGAPRAFDVTVATRVVDQGWVAAEDGSFGGPGDQQGYACAASEDGFLVVGSDDRSGNVNARAWLSDDGRTWTEIESSALGGAGDQWPSAVAVVPDDDDGGWLVGGVDTARGDGDIALWRVTADGEVSRRDTGESALAGPGDQTVTNIAVDGDGRVTIAGSDYGRVGLWESDSVDR